MPVKNQVKGVKEAKTHRSKKKKKAVSHFFEDEADEDEDEDDDVVVKQGKFPIFVLLLIKSPV